MASGGIALILEPAAHWHQFRRHARYWIKRLGAAPIAAPVISENECLWDVQLEGGRFWITYDDWQASIQLEPQNPSFNNTVIELQRALRENGT